MIGKETQLVQFLGRTVSLSFDENTPITVLGNEDKKDFMFSLFLDFLNRLKVSGILDKPSEGLILIADD